MSEVVVDDNIVSSKDLDMPSSENRWKAERINTERNGTEKDISLSQIVNQIRERFNIPVSSGKVTDREASGIYKTQAEAIRTRISNNLPTISHELGHHLNKQYNLSGLESIAEVKDIVSEDFLNKYRTDEINGELVAEFTRQYIKNKNEARNLCPDFYDDFVNSLSKSDLKALNEVAELTNKYMSYGLSQKYEASVINAKQAAKMQKSKLSEEAHKAYTYWIDGFHPIKQLTDFVEETSSEEFRGEKNMYTLAANSLNAHQISNYVLREGFRDLDGNISDDAKSFAECIQNITEGGKKSVAEFDVYVKLKHALEVIAQGKRVFADESLENSDNIKEEIARLEKKHPEFVQAAENIYEYQYNLLKHFAVPSGLMTTEQVEYLHNKYPCYVPFYRFNGKNTMGSFARGSFVNQGGLIKNLKGSGLDTQSHLESIVRNTDKIVKAALRNQTAVVLADYADTVDGIGQFIERVRPICYRTLLMCHRRKTALPNVCRMWYPPERIFLR